MAPWIGFMAPKATAPAIVERLNRTITEILSRPEIKASWTKQGAVPVTMTQPELKISCSRRSKNGQSDKGQPHRADQLKDGERHFR
jgi:tripartite-type tricarboxylate transporter receptor subunit TctC